MKNSKYNNIILGISIQYFAYPKERTNAYKANEIDCQETRESLKTLNIATDIQSTHVHRSHKYHHETLVIAGNKIVMYLLTVFHKMYIAQV